MTSVHEQAERLAVELLPCTIFCEERARSYGGVLPGHPPACIAYYRPTIATALESQMLVAERVRDNALDDAIAKAEESLLVFDGNPDVKTGVVLAGKLIVHAIRKLKTTAPRGEKS